MKKIFLLIIFILIIGSIFTSCMSQEEKATKLFYSFENNFEEAKNVLLVERKALKIKKIIIFKGEVRSKIKEGISPNAIEQIEKLNSIGVMSIEIQDGIIWFYTAGALGSETAIVYVDKKIDKLPKNNRPFRYENVPSLKERWYLYDTA